MSSPNSQPGQRASGGLTIRRIKSHPPSRQTTTFLALQEANQTTGSSGAEPARALNTPTESYNLFLQPSSTGRPVLKASLAVELVCHLRPGKGREKMNVGMRTSTLCLGAAFKIRLLLFILTWATLQPCLPDISLLTWLPRLTLDLPCHCGLALSSLGCGWPWLPSLDLSLLALQPCHHLATSSCSQPPFPSRASLSSCLPWLCLQVQGEECR